jgi:predicted Zn-dependent peptidase
MSFYKEFENGLRLVLKPMNAVRSLTIGVWVGTGSAFETEAENGISHFIEHMLFKGTAKRSAFEIADAVDRLGAQTNAFTAKECTCFYTKSIDEHAEKCFEILSDIFFNSVFDEKEMEREKSVICEEIGMVEDAPEDVCHELLAEAMFDGHCLGRRILGPAENVRRFSRAGTADYMRRRYTSKNTVIALAGNITEEDAVALTRTYFADKFVNVSPPEGSVCPHVTTPQFRGKVKEIEQANIALGFPSIAFNSPETYPMMLFNNVFGGSMSARLFQKIREELGLAYSIYSYLSSYKGCGVYSVFCGTGPDNAEKAVLAIRREIERVVRDGVTADEFARGKEQLKGGFILGQENTSSVMNVLGKTLVISGEVFDLDEKIERIKAITPDEVRDAYMRSFDFDRMCAACVSSRETDVLNILRG